MSSVIAKQALLVRSMHRCLHIYGYYIYNIYIIYVRASLLRSLKKFRALNIYIYGYYIWIYIYIYMFSLKRVSHDGQVQRHAEICTCCVGCFTAALCWPRVGCWWQRCIGRASAVRAALYRPHVSSAVSAACWLFVTALYRPH